MKSIKQHIFEKLKVSNNTDSTPEFMYEFEILVKRILDISKSHVSNKNDFKTFVSNLKSYLDTCCENESIKYSTKDEVNNSTYNKHSLYFHQYYTSNEFELHYDTVTYHFEYTRSKLKMEKFEEDTYYRQCQYRFSGFTSLIYEFPDEMIDNFNKNIGKL